jgi:hypothetical protein
LGCTGVSHENLDSQLLSLDGMFGVSVRRNISNSFSMSHLLLEKCYTMISSLHLSVSGYIASRSCMCTTGSAANIASLLYNFDMECLDMGVFCLPFFSCNFIVESSEMMCDPVHTKILNLFQPVVRLGE